MNWFVYGYQNLGVKLKIFSTHIIIIVFTQTANETILMSHGGKVLLESVGLR